MSLGSSAGLRVRCEHDDITDGKNLDFVIGVFMRFFMNVLIFLFAAENVFHALVTSVNPRNTQQTCHSTFHVHTEDTFYTG